MKTRINKWLILFLVAVGLYAVDLWHPVDRLLWRESDLASIARNFDREGMHILQPRIDWRGDGPGYVEMEFPAYPWMIAVLYKIFGQHEIIGRFLSYLFTLLAVLVFFRMARSWLEPPGSYIASSFFVVSPLIVQISNVIQPEPFMLLFVLLAIYYFILWKDGNSWKHFTIAALATAMAILAKISNAYIGLFFLFILLQHKGLRTFRDYRVYIFGLIALLPPLLWYVHANSFWVDYGNSLGASNEYHWIGWDFFTNIYFIKGLLFNELFFVYMPVGIVVVVYGLFSKQYKNTQVFQYGYFWLISVYIYYLLTIRTTVDLWSIYYHIASVAPFALLFGIVLNKLLKTRNEKIHFRMVYAIFALIFILTIVSSAWYIRPPYMGENKQLMAFVISALFVIISLMIRKWGMLKFPSTRANWPLTIVYFLVSLTFLYQSYKIYEIFRVAKPAHVYTQCVADLRTIIPKNTLILASGGNSLDPTGYPVAYNSSYFFYWLNKKGFNISVEDQSIGKIEEFSSRGAEFFVAESRQLNEIDGFENEMRKNYPVFYEKEGIILFDIRKH